ncbi:MAG: cupredoxin domain-containing protein [Jatrophihabitantaceae bacterium]
MRKVLGTIAALATLAIGVSACGSSGNGAGSGGQSPPTVAPSTSRSSMSTMPTGTGSTTAAPSGDKSSMPAASAIITIKNFDYDVSGPVHAGEKVTVKNNDDVNHTVTADSGNAFNVNVPSGGSATFTSPSKPGTYKFHCNYHANMHGTLVVK